MLKSCLGDSPINLQNATSSSTRRNPALWSPQRSRSPGLALVTSPWFLAPHTLDKRLDREKETVLLSPLMLSRGATGDFPVTCHSLTVPDSSSALSLARLSSLGRRGPTYHSGAKRGQGCVTTPHPGDPELPARGGGVRRGGSPGRGWEAPVSAHLIQSAGP